MTDWVVKVSKLCNLRCRYCYEFPNLAKRERMSLETWRALLVTAAQQREAEALRHGEDSTVTRFIWHGGEPLLLPQAYFDAVLSEQRAAFGAAALASGKVRNALQTNLYRPDFGLIEHLHAAGFAFGVSHDMVPGLRIAANGRDSADDVERNLYRLEALGIPAGVIIVLARHTLPHLLSIYRRLRGNGRNARFLPFAAEHGAADMLAHAPAPGELARALAPVFLEWLSDGCPIEIDPFDDCLRVLTSESLGLEQAPVDRAHRGDAVLVVEPQGAIRTGCELSDACDQLGNVRECSWVRVRESPAYRRSLQRDEDVRARVCGDCEFSGACNGLPALRFDLAAARDGYCTLYRPLLQLLRGELAGAGWKSADFNQTFCDTLVVTNDALQSERRATTARPAYQIVGEGCAADRKFECPGGTV